MSANSRAYLILGLVFVLGAATGAGAMYATSRRGPRHLDRTPGRGYIERRLGELNEAIALTPEQQTQVSAIFERQREPRVKLLREIMDRCGDPLRQMGATTDAEIRALLTPDQQPKFDNLLRTREKRSALP